MRIKVSELRTIIKETLEEAYDTDIRQSTIGDRLPDNASPIDEISWPWSSKEDESETSRHADDYEECAECGYDHAYEPLEAFEAHRDAESDMGSDLSIASDMSRQKHRSQGHR